MAKKNSSYLQRLKLFTEFIGQLEITVLRLFVIVETVRLLFLGR